MTRPLAAIALAGFTALSLPAAAQPAPPPPAPRIMVSGEGEASLRPDMAVVTLSVMREADNARAALDAANDAMAAVISAMKAAGIAERDLQTSGLSIQPRYVFPQPNDGSRPPEIQGYQVSNTLSVRVREVNRVGEVIDKAVTLGVNQGGQIVFTNEDPSAARSAARKAAVKDALDKARELAEAAGLSVGRVIEINETTTPMPPMPMNGRVMRMEAAKADAVPVEAGENTFRIEITLTVEIGG